MHVITVRNVNEALGEAMWYLHTCGTDEETRNGTARVAPGPVCTTYRRPLERVLFSRVRDANPFFHFFEALWMLAGRNDVAFPSRFAARLREYSDNGTTLHGAYGFRWREAFSFDQLEHVVKLLRQDPSSRRAVIGMWSPEEDLLGPTLRSSTKDLPCNTHVYVDLRGGKLNMLVSNRSNDAVWGAFGANVVHFAFLQEYLAACLRVPVGLYHQMSFNLHAYKSLPNFEQLSIGLDIRDLYRARVVSPAPLLAADEVIEDWDTDLYHFFEEVEKPAPHYRWKTLYFSAVVLPMLRCWEARKKDHAEALRWAEVVSATDWGCAAQEWVRRRHDAKQEAA